MEQPDLEGLELLRVQSYGQCPHCGYSVSYLQGVRTQSWQSIVAEGGYCRCPECRKWVGADDLKRGYKRPRDRQVQIRELRADGTVFVHYGPTHGVKQELSSRGSRLPEGFRGNGQQLAQQLGRSVEDLSQHFGESTTPFADRVFDVGKADVQQ